jgi:hypothetical protein
LGPGANPVPAASAPDGGNPAALPTAEPTTASGQQFNGASPIALFGGENGASGTKSATTEGAASQSGMDARLLWLAGFGALFAIGLTIALLPRLPRGRGRGTRT